MIYLAQRMKSTTASFGSPSSSASMPSFVMTILAKSAYHWALMASADECSILLKCFQPRSRAKGVPSGAVLAQYEWKAKYLRTPALASRASSHQVVMLRGGGGMVCTVLASSGMQPAGGQSVASTHVRAIRLSSAGGYASFAPELLTDRSIGRSCAPARSERFE